MTNDENISKHAVTHPKKCREIADRYGWKLLRVETTKSKVLKFDCIFEGDTQFPNYQEGNKDE
jgi:hypothetical protein